MFTITLLSTAMALSLSVAVWRMVRDDRRRREARVHALTDLAVRPDLHASSAAPALTLAPIDHPPVWGTRAAIIGCLALAITTVILLTLTARTRLSIPAADGPAASSSAPPPLELLSLRDTHEDGTLTIAGLVGNPRSGNELRNIKVTADLFDRSGSLVASGAAAVDVKTLAPGDQSPFVLSVATGDRVARYRVSFRAPDGRVIEHVDRRQRSPQAASW